MKRRRSKPRAANDSRIAKILAVADAWNAEDEKPDSLLWGSGHTIVELFLDELLFRPGACTYATSREALAVFLRNAPPRTLKACEKLAVKESARLAESLREYSARLALVALGMSETAADRILDDHRNAVQTSAVSAGTAVIQ